MKARLLLVPLLALTLAGCSDFATMMAGVKGFSAGDINGTWKHMDSGVTVSISGVSDYGSGSGRLTAAGSVYPSGAVGGNVLREVEHQSGGYWDAYHYQYSTSGSWHMTHVVGLAMEEDKKSFRIGSAVYVKQ
jgi:hypothetical protein